MKKQVFNPYLPLWEYIPDGEPRVFGDRLYIYGSHDRFNGTWYCENDYVTWSAPLSDLSDWRYEGVIFRKEQDKRPRNLYAPDCVQGPDGRYYLFYSKDDSSVIGVAVCDTPAGQFAFYGEVRYPDGRILGDSEGEYFMFDPSVLIADGHIWLYSGSSRRGTTTKVKRNMAGCTVTELEKDMLTVKTAPKVILPGTKSWNTEAYFEGPSARKIGDLYYIVYPVRNGSGLHYATSRFPERDFIHRGPLHSTSDIGLNGHSRLNPAYPAGNNHGGLVELNGQWYIFDHRQTNGTGFSRQGVAEPIMIQPDGTISQVESTSCGLNGGPLREEGSYPASIACCLMGGKVCGVRLPGLCPKVTQSGKDGDENADFFIAGMKNGSVAGYKYFACSGGKYQIDMTFRGDGGDIYLCLDEKGRSILGHVSLSPSNTWQNATLTAEIPQGRQALYFLFHGKGSIDFKQFIIRKER